jgi:hypothetical protein
MGFFGKAGFFGPLETFRGKYHPSVYAKYSRGGGYQNGVGTLGKAFAYTRPKFSGGGAADNSDPTAFDSSDPIFNQPRQQPRRPGQVEGALQAIQQWGQGPEGVSQRFANPGLWDIERASDSLQRTVDSDTADKIQKHTDKIADEVAPGLPSPKQRAKGGNVASGIESNARKYQKRPANSANNDPHSGYQAARGAGDYSFGPVTSRFSNEGAEITPHGHGEVKRRGGEGEDYLPSAQRRAYERDSRFARGGQAKMTPVWKDRPFAVSQNTKVGNGLKIHAPHSGSGLVMNIHLSDVGPHAISFHSGPEGYSGGVNLERMASHAMQADDRSQAFHPFQAPQVAAAAPNTFGGLLGQMPYSAGPAPNIPTPRPMMPRPQGMSAWNAEGVRTLARM